VKVDTTITGVNDVELLLNSIAPNQAKNIMRATVHDMAKEVRDDARGDMPEDEGTMKAVTGHKRERALPWGVASTVRVGKEAFYWRFLEYGDGPDGVAYDFFLKSVHKMRGKMMGTFLTSFGKKFEAAAARAAKRAAK
jgi:hypothetical protein